MKAGVIQILLPFVVAGSGIVVFNFTKGKKSSVDEFYHDAEKLETVEDLNDVSNKIEKFKDQLDPVFVEEFNDAKPHLENLLKLIDKYSTDDAKPVYKTEYLYFSTKDFKYLNGQNLIKRYFSCYPYLDQFNNKEVVNEQGYSFKLTVDNSRYGGGSYNFVFNLPVRKDQPAEEVRIKDSDNNTKAYVLLKEFLNPTKNKNDIKFTFVSPFVFDIETKAGSFRFDEMSKFIDVVNKNVKNLNKDNVNETFKAIDTIVKCSYALGEDFNKVITDHGEEIKTLANLRSYDKTNSSSYLEGQYSKLFPALYDHCMPVLSNDDLLKMFHAYPYFDICKNTIVTNSDGYSVGYSYHEVSSSKGDCSLVLNVPLEAGKGPESLTIRKGAEEGATTFSSDYGAYKLIGEGEGLKERNISINFVSPYVFNVVTPAGTFKFDFLAQSKADYLEKCKTINPDNFYDIFKWFDTYLYLFPSDFIEEYKLLNQPIRDLFSYQKNSSSLFDNMMNFNEAMLNALSSRQVKYFDSEHLSSFLLLYPYFNKYNCEKIYSGDTNYYISMYNARTANSGTNYVDSFEVFVPFETGGAPVLKSYSLDPTSSARKFYDSAFALIDRNTSLVTDNISIKLTAPYVMKVTTPGGSFMFDFAANDNRILMEKLDKVDSSNYTAIFEEIDSKLESLPAKFKSEYSTVKEPLTYLFSKHYYNNLGVDSREYDSVYHTLFDRTYEYLTPSKYLKYFLIYPYFSSEFNQEYTCEENSSYSFKFTFEYTLPTIQKGHLDFEFNLPMTEGSDEIKHGSFRDNDGISSDLTLANHLFNVFDDGSIFTKNKFDLRFEFVSPGVIRAITPAGSYTFKIK